MGGRHAVPNQPPGILNRQASSAVRPLHLPKAEAHPVMRRLMRWHGSTVAAWLDIIIQNFNKPTPLA
jgi:hypothetical protein